MAISKERLEELIKEKKPVYKENLRKLYIYKWKRYDFMGNTINKNLFEEVISLEDLFETEEEAKFALEFQNIERVEKLSLPTWEEIEYDEVGYYVYKFHIKNNYNFFGKLMLWKSRSGTGTINIEEMVQGWLEKIYFKEPLTKENYLKACSICKKLFLGEKIDG